MAVNIPTGSNPLTKTASKRNKTGGQFMVVKEAAKPEGVRWVGGVMAKVVIAGVVFLTLLIGFSVWVIGL
ncbi:hypothetical protein [Bradyrhizobium sp. USDA 4486]